MVKTKKNPYISQISHSCFATLSFTFSKTVDLVESIKEINFTRKREHQLINIFQMATFKEMKNV